MPSQIKKTVPCPQRVTTHERKELANREASYRARVLCQLGYISPLVLLVMSHLRTLVQHPQHLRRKPLHKATTNFIQTKQKTTIKDKHYEGYIPPYLLFLVVSFDITLLYLRISPVLWAHVYRGPVDGQLSNG